MVVVVRGRILISRFRSLVGHIHVSGGGGFLGGDVDKLG